MTENGEDTAMEFVAATLWASVPRGGDTYNPWSSVPEDEKSMWRRIAAHVIDTAEPVWRQRIGVETQYGNRIKLSEEAHGPGVYATDVLMEDHARYFAAENDNRTLVRRAVGPWVEVHD